RTLRRRTGMPETETTQDNGAVASQDAVAAAIEEMRPRYCRVLVDFARRLRAAESRIAAGASDPAARADIGFIAHRISGLAASFGWPELGQLAAKVDGLAQRDEHSAELPGILPDLIAAIDDAVSGV